MLIEFLAFLLPAPLPPLDYRVDGVQAAILFTTEDKVDYICTNGRPDPAWIVKACAKVGGPYITMPHPCLYKDQTYARLLCHELGHTSGWTSNHPNPQED